ncbi:Calcium/proton exchanger [Xylariaceae sp. FL1272]|nr:Calcium/proton exchanger [Xylariaceae sp. FL1272]
MPLTMDKVNLMKIKSMAHRYGRTDESSTAKFNPFRRFDWKTPRRSGTWNGRQEDRAINEAEEGLHHSQTSPARIGDDTNSQQSDQPDPTSQGESATTAVGSSPSQNGIDGIRKRGTHKSSSSEKANGGSDDNKYQPKGHFTWKNQIQRTLFSSWINILLFAAPVGIALWQLQLGGPAIFVVNFIAIIPLAALLSEATEQIAMRTGETIGGLINATFGNAVELIVAIIALIDGQVTVVQTSLVGSILSNLLLVLGFCFLCGGFNRPEQYFNTTVAQTAASLLALAVSSLIVPTIFSHTPDFYTDDEVTSLPSYAVPQLSHGVALILLLVYASYLFFQLKTHSDMFAEESQKVATKPVFKRGSDDQLHSVSAGVGMAGNGIIPRFNGQDDQQINLMQSPPRTPQDEDEDEAEEPQLHFWVAVAALTIYTVIIALCSEGLVSGIDSIKGSISEEFIGLILLPIVGNACEHATAVTVAVKDKMDLAIGVAIGSSMQVALFLIPLLVIIGWGIGNEEMTLAFDTFQIVVLFVAVLLVNYLIGDGKSHWLEGVQLITLYVIIALCAFYYPNGTGVTAA